MPVRVPTYNNYQTTPTTLPQVRAEGALTVEQATVGGRQLQNFGKAVEGAGETWAAIEIDAQKQANELRVADASNKLKELEYKLKYDKEGGYINLHGVDALQRPSGKPLADEYAEAYQKGIGEITDSLGNDAQKQAFASHAAGALADFHGAAMAHEGQQFKEYAISVHDGTIANSLNDISINYNNPEIINKNLDAIKAAGYESAKMNDKSAVWAEAHTRELTSKAHLTAIESALQKNDPQYADAYMKRYAKDMQADDILRANGVLTKQFDSQIAMSTAREVMQDATAKIDPSSSDRAFNIAVGTESGGKQFGKDGKPLTSKAGAIGIAQVMPDTAPEAAKLAGMEWDEELYKTDEIYNYMLGKAYFGQQLKENGGNLAKAYAAYNAGPQRLKDGLAAAEKAGTPELWVKYMPAETQAYVAKNMKEYGSGGGQPVKPTLLDVQNAVREKIDPQHPERLKMALDEVERQFNDTQKAVKQREEEATATALDAVFKNGGKFNELPADIIAAVPPGKLGEVMDFAKKVGKGVEPETDWSLYYGFKSAPQALGSINLMAFRNRLADTEFKELTNLQVDVSQGKNDTLEKLRSSKEVLNQFMRESGIDPSPKDDDKKGAAKVGKVWSMFESRIRTRETQLGRPLNATEQREEAGRMFMSVDIPGAIYGTNKKPYAAAYAEDSKVEIPEKDRQAIVDSLKAKKLVPTPDVIEFIYLRQKGVIR